MVDVYTLTKDYNYNRLLLLHHFPFYSFKNGIMRNLVLQWFNFIQNKFITISSILLIDKTSLEFFFPISVLL